MPRRQQTQVPPLAEREKPGLSATLKGPRAPDRCQSCGRLGDVDDAESLRRWRECDPWDKPTDTIVILCNRCEKKLIESHPRLYLAIRIFTPLPGAIPLCRRCQHRDALQCRHPDLRRNGGSGLAITTPPPSMAHFNYGGGRGEWGTLYPGPALECAGREESVYGRE